MRMKKLIALLLVMMTLFAPLGAKTAVVLSGGGARGLAHIAILEAIEAEGIPIDLIVGTSMGALIGSLYSAGYTPKEMRALITETDLLGLFLHGPTANHRGQGRAFTTPFEPIFTLGFSAEGLERVPAILGDQRILELLGFLLAKHPAPMDFDTLPIPFRAVSTDAVTAEAVVHESGSLVQAVRSSIAIPVVFAPFPTTDGRLLLDGGMVDNLPIDLARKLGATTVIASDVNSELIDNLAKLENFTAIAMQAMTLATYTKAVAQHEHADLLFVVPLKDINAMDFGQWAEIISRGEEEVARQKDALRALAARIGETQALQPLDPDRTGVYAQLPDPKIRRIVVQDLSTVQSKRPLDTRLFSSFIGRKIDAQSDEELKQRLREVRLTKGLSSLSYEMGADGTLILLQRGYGKSQGQVTMGFRSDVGFAYANPGAATWFRADAYLRATVNELLKSPFSLEVYAQLGSKSEVRTTFSYPHSLRSWGRIGADLSVGYQVGGLTPLSEPIHPNRSAPLDRIVDVSLGTEFSVGESLLMRFDTHYQHAFFHNPSYTPKRIDAVTAIASLHYSTMSSRFSNQGIHTDLLHAIGYDGDLTWQSRIFFMQKFALGSADSLSYSGEISIIRGPFQLLNSYSDLGGLEGIPGFGPATIRRDRALVGLLWQHRWFEVLGYPTYLKATVRGGIFDGYDPYSGAAPVETNPFSQLNWDVGAGVCLALDAPIGEVVLSIGASVKGKVAVIVGVY